MNTIATDAYAIISSPRTCAIATSCGVDFPNVAKASFGPRGLEVVLPQGILELSGLTAERIGAATDVFVGDTDSTGAFRNSCSLVFRTDAD